MQEQLDQDKCTTIRQIASACDMSKTTAHRLIKKDLRLQKLAPKYIPKVLTQAQKDFRVKLSTENLDKLSADPGLLARLIATDESWIFTYDPRTKFADMQWTAPGDPRPRKALRG